MLGFCLGFSPFEFLLRFGAYVFIFVRMNFCVIFGMYVFSFSPFEFLCYNLACMCLVFVRLNFYG